MISKDEKQVLDNIVQRIIAHYGGDLQQTLEWLQAKNSSLGDISPLSMIQEGKFDKLLGELENPLEDLFDE